MERLLENLKNVRRDSNGFNAQCPAHEDNKNSLNIATGDDGRTLLNCKAGCSTVQIVKSIGLNMRDLFPEKPKPQESKIVATYDYHDEECNVLFQKVRFEPKDFRCRVKTESGYNYSINGTRRVLYRLPELIKSDTVYIVEGEKDVETLRKHGLTATTNFDGAGKWLPEYNPFFSGKTVYIIPDNDSAGEKHAQTIFSNLSSVAKKLEFIRTPSPAKDTSDFFASGNTIDDFNALPHSKTTRIVSDVILDDDQPDTIAAAFKLHSRVLHRYNRYDGWSIYHAGRYQRVDDPKEIRLHIRKFLSNCYVIKNIKGEDRRIRINKQSSSFISDCLECLAALEDVHILPSKKAPNSLDGTLNPKYTIATSNYFVDISSKPHKTQPISKNFYTFNYLDYDYKPTAFPEKWGDFLVDITKGDMDIMLLLQQWCGYLLLPTMKHQKFLLCVGDGANGKGVFFDTISAALGKHNVSNIPLSRFDSPYALYGTYGKLVNMSNENAKNLEDNAESIIKEYVSGDKIAWEQKYKDTFFDYPTAKLMFSTNETPRIKDASDGIWRRLIMVPFDAKFDEKTRNINLSKTLQNPDELSGILNWMIEGAEILEKDGKFVSPKRCEEALNQYRLESDSARQFLHENTRKSENPEAEIPCNELYSAYRKWCELEGLKPKNSNNFGTSFFKFCMGQKHRIRDGNDRIYVYKGIELLQNNDYLDKKW